MMLNISEAVTHKNVGILQGNESHRMETLKQLGYMVGQNVESVHFGEKYTFKCIDKYLNGLMFTGSWCCIDLPVNQEMVSFMAAQIHNVYKIMQENSVGNQAMSKLNIAVNQNIAFFVNVPQNSHQKVPSFANGNRSINFVKPNFDKIFAMLSFAEDLPLEIGEKFTTAIDSIK